MAEFEVQPADESPNDAIRVWAYHNAKETGRGLYPLADPDDAYSRTPKRLRVVAELE